jgi:hypothetical protein
MDGAVQAPRGKPAASGFQRIQVGPVLQLLGGIPPAGIALE